MSMQPHYNWYQNPNNLVAVPSVIENVNSNVSSVCLPASGESGFHDNKVVINYGNVHFSGCVDASTCVYNPYIPAANNARHETISQPCTPYSNRHNLVDLTGLNHLAANLTIPHSTFRSIEHNNEAFDYDYAKGINSHNNEIYSYSEDYDLEVKLPPVSTHHLHDSFVMIPDPNNMSIDKMTRVMTKYCKYDDLRDVIEERHTKIRSESKTTSKRKDIEDSNDLKHLIRGRTEKRERILNTERKEDLSSRLGIGPKNTGKIKRNINSIQKETTNSVRKLNNSSKSSHMLERKYSQSSIERNPGLLERKTLSKAQKSNLSPDALKRYLAYQRFLRNCYKSQSLSPQKLIILKKDNSSKDKYSSQLNDKPPKQLKRETKNEDKKVKSYNSFDKTKTKEKANKTENCIVDQKDRKVESKTKVTNYNNIKSKKGKSKVKVTSYVDQKDKISKSKIKETIKLEEKRKQDEINAKLAKYLEKKKKRQELKERLFGCEDRKKDKAESEAKLLKYLKQNRKQISESNGESQTSSSSNLLNKRDDSVDLRTVLTRKRTKNLSHKEPKRVKTTTSQHENLTITVEQGRNNKKESEKVTRTASKVKTIKTKRIKLVINIVCPNSASSDDSDQTSKDPCTSPHQDLSFLDDFNVDEIVDSLNVSSIQTDNDISYKNCHSENVCANECADTQIEFMSNVGEVNSSVILSDLHAQQEEFNTELTTNESSNNEEQQIVASHNEQNDCIQSCENVIQTNENIINISDDKAIDTISTKQNLGYCDDVYEVIDITDDVNSNVVILEDIIDLDSNEHHKNSELTTKPSASLKEKAETILQKSNKIILNLEKDINEKGKPNTSNEVDQNIASAELILEVDYINSKEVTIPMHKNRENNVDIENCNAIAKEITLFDIKDINSRNISEDICIKNNDINENIKPLQEKHFNTLKGPTTKPNGLDTFDITKCHTNSVLNTNLDTLSCKIPGYENTLVNILKEHHNNVQLPDSFNKSKTKSENTCVVQKTVPVSEIIDIDECETKSEKIEAVVITDIKQPLNNTVITNHTDTTNDQISEPANKSNNENRKITPQTSSVQANQVEKPAKTEQNEIISTAKTVLGIETNNESITPTAAVNNKSVKNRVYVKVGQVIQPAKPVPSIKNPYVRGIEKRMLEYLNSKFTITALIHRGYFSSVYKCRDPAGKNYAIKIVKCKYRSMSIYKDKILSDLQRSTTEDKYIGILRIIESFNSSGEWCFLSEYYPRNLKQALLEYGKCFHIDRVQFLARQLVAAVTTLTNNQIIHADIKPSHILLNSTNDNLKLCSFDRSDYNYNIRIIPSSGTASYRAPEMILGYDADYRIDVWSTALVMYEMATGIQLFPGRFNNDILYKQLCTLGPLNYDMLENCTLQNMHFLGTKFMRQLDNQKWVFVQFSGTNNKLRNKLFTSYNRDWRSTRTQWQVTEDLDKIEMLYKLLQQMLAMDPRHRLPITYVEANEFIYDYSISDKEIE